MIGTKIAGLALAFAMAGILASVKAAVALPGVAGPAAQAPQTAPPGASVRSIGSIQAIHGNLITLKTDTGSEVSVQVADAARIVRVEPGQKTLKGATRIRLQDLQVGDRILVGGKAGASTGSLVAFSVIVMKRTDIEREQHQEEEEWQKHGVGGLVQTVDVATRTVVIKARVRRVDKTITIHASPGVILRRYAPGSVSFQSAKPGAFDQIKPGDQLRARGTLSADGSALAAAEIVSGTFRNIAGTVISTDPGTNEVTVMDLITKQPVVVKITTESELRKLPEGAAQMIAMRLKPRTAAGYGSGPQGRPISDRGTAEASHQAQAAHPEGMRGSPPDLDQILRRLPAITVADLHKGDAVMIVSTEGATSGAVTAIKLVSGVEPILTASPTGRQQAVLQSLWSGFSTSGNGGGGGAAGAEAPNPPSR